MAISWHRVARTALALFGIAAAHPGLATDRPAGARPDIGLTTAEQAWIEAHPLIRVVTLDNYAPYLVTQPDGKLAGLSVNLIDLVAQRTGLQFEYHKHGSVESALAEFKSGGGDVLPALARSPEREKFALYTQPYATAFAVIVTRTDSPYHNSLQELNGLNVGCLRGAVQNRLVTAAAPQCRLVEYDTVQQSLVALAAGKLDATYASVGTAAYYIKHLQLANLRLGSVIGESTQLHVGVRRDWPELAGIIDKALASVTPAERKTLDDQWIFVAEAPNRWLPWLKVAASIASVATILALLLFYFYRRMARELAARLKIQAELEKAHAELARVSEEKSAMMSSLAHDLRSPLTSLLLGTELLQNSLPGDHAEALNLIGIQQDSCRKLIRQVDELVHPQVQQTGRREPKWTELDLVAIVRESLGGIAAAAQAKDIPLEFDTEAPSLRLLSDKSALQHVLDNLLSNAVKYSPRGRPVRLELRRHENGYLVHCIDQGPGVPESEREHIFERFARGQAQPTAGETSTGLGLWIVRRALEHLHGKVWCGPGRDSIGATFSVYLPSAPPARDGRNPA